MSGVFLHSGGDADGAGDDRGQGAAQRQAAPHAQEVSAQPLLFRHVSGRPPCRLPPLPKAPHTQSDRSSCLAQQPDADGGPRPCRAMERALKVMGLGSDGDAGSSDSGRSVDGACASPRKLAAAPPANGQQLEDAPAADQPVRPPCPQSLRACGAGPRRLAQFQVAHVRMSCQAAGESSASSFAGIVSRDGHFLELSVMRVSCSAGRGQRRRRPGADAAAESAAAREVAQLKFWRRRA